MASSYVFDAAEADVMVPDDSLLAIVFRVFDAAIEMSTFQLLRIFASPFA